VQGAEKEGPRYRTKMIGGVIRRSAPRASAINVDWWVTVTSKIAELPPGFNTLGRELARPA